MKEYEISPQYVVLAKMIAELMQSKFHGHLEIKFKNGKIVGCYKTESFIIE